MKTKIALVFVLSTIPLARTKANQMPVSPTPLVSILPATPANLPLLDSGVVAKFHPNAFILANNSDRGIVGLVVQWRFTDASGKERTSLVRTDSFMQAANSGPIIAPHTRLLAAPGAFINEGTLGKQRIGMPIEKMDGTRDKAINHRRRD